MHHGRSQPGAGSPFLCHTGALVAGYDSAETELLATAILHDEFAGEKTTYAAETVKHHVLRLGRSIIFRPNKAGQLLF